MDSIDENFDAVGPGRWDFDSGHGNRYRNRSLLTRNQGSDIANPKAPRDAHDLAPVFPEQDHFKTVLSVGLCRMHEHPERNSHTEGSGKSWPIDPSNASSKDVEQSLSDGGPVTEQGCVGSHPMRQPVAAGSPWAFELGLCH